jgi:hypothetical protein
MVMNAKKRLPAPVVRNSLLNRETFRGSARKLAYEPHVILCHEERVDYIDARAAIDVRNVCIEINGIEPHVVLRYEKRIDDIDVSAPIDVAL